MNHREQERHAIRKAIASGFTGLAAGMHAYFAPSLLANLSCGSTPIAPEASLKPDAPKLPHVLSSDPATGTQNADRHDATQQPPGEPRENAADACPVAVAGAVR